MNRLGTDATLMERDIRAHMAQAYRADYGPRTEADYAEEYAERMYRLAHDRAVDGRCSHAATDCPTGSYASTVTLWRTRDRLALARSCALAWRQDHGGQQYVECSLKYAATVRQMQAVSR